MELSAENPSTTPLRGAVPLPETSSGRIGKGHVPAISNRPVPMRLGRPG